MSMLALRSPAQALSVVRPAYTPPRIPYAHQLPLGAVVLSTTGPQREDLVGSLVVGGLLVFLAGVGVGASRKWPKQR